MGVTIAARPDVRRTQAQFGRDQMFQRGPRLFERLSGGGCVVSVGLRQARKGLAALLQSGQHISRVPVSFPRSRARAHVQKILFRELVKSED
jgi:hypothetical protein